MFEEGAAMKMIKTKNRKGYERLQINSHALRRTETKEAHPIKRGTIATEHKSLHEGRFYKT